MIGIDRDSGATVDDGGDETQANNPGFFALALHGGLPLVFAASTHFAFEVIPELNIGFATGGIDDESMGSRRDLRKRLDAAELATARK